MESAEKENWNPSSRAVSLQANPPKHETSLQTSGSSLPKLYGKKPLRASDLASYNRYR
ncbi:hypothetical protein GCM10023156_39900 [Novipirellula rosea]|uniref:Uncharacterized protein n=1 Tax=Novipirellula rosea TaxID=1031540 RepID=A0ABP8N1S1_9BACT